MVTRLVAFDDVASAQGLSRLGCAVSLGGTRIAGIVRPALACYAFFARNPDWSPKSIVQLIGWVLIVFMLTFPVNRAGICASVRRGAWQTPRRTWLLQCACGRRRSVIAVVTDPTVAVLDLNSERATSIPSSICRLDALAVRYWMMGKQQPWTQDVPEGQNAPSGLATHSVTPASHSVPVPAQKIAQASPESPPLFWSPSWAMT